VPPFAICSKESCVYTFDMQVDKESHFKIPSLLCPKCKSKVILYCPECYSPLFHRPGQQDPRCGYCMAHLKETVHG